MITEFHEAVAGVLHQGGVPTLAWIPEDLPEAPVVVVGPVEGRPSPEPGVFSLELDVLVAGRRIFDPDAQAELNKVTDQLIDLFGGTRGIRFDNVRMSIDSFARRQLQVAGNDVPVYAVTIETTSATC